MDSSNLGVTLVFRGMKRLQFNPGNEGLSVVLWVQIPLEDKETSDVFLQRVFLAGGKGKSRVEARPRAVAALWRDRCGSK